MSDKAIKLLEEIYRRDVPDKNDNIGKALVILREPPADEESLKQIWEDDMPCTKGRCANYDDCRGACKQYNEWLRNAPGKAKDSEPPAGDTKLIEYCRQRGKILQRADYNKVSQQTGKLLCDAADRMEQQARVYDNKCIAELEAEKDSAITHDRQPYPTADAYEKVCNALAKARERITELEAKVERLKKEVAQAVGLMQECYSVEEESVYGKIPRRYYGEAMDMLLNAIGRPRAHD